MGEVVETEVERMEEVRECRMQPGQQPEHSKIEINSQKIQAAPKLHIGLHELNY